MQISAWDVAAVGIKAILYAATLSAAGGVFFLFYSAALVSAEHQRGIRRWIGICTAVGLAASALRLSILAGSMGETAASLVDGEMMRMILGAGEARATGIRVAGLLLIASLAMTRRPSLLAVLGAVIAATSFAWIGHAWAIPTHDLSLALVSLHLVGIAFWLGALVPLLIIARGSELRLIASAAGRFGHIAMVIVTVLLAAGTFLLWLLLDALSDLWNTDYGRAILLKLVLVSGILSLAAFNKWVLTPRLESNQLRALTHLRRSIQIEMVLGSLILIVTAIFTTTMGPSTLD